MSHCRHPRSPAPCLCAWPEITPTEYQALLERRRTQHVAAYEAGADLSTDPDAARRMAAYFQTCEPHHFWADGDPDFTAPRTPTETPAQRKARIHASRVRRLARARTTAARLATEFEATKPLDHGELSIPGRAGATITDTALDRWRAYQAAQTTARRLTGLLAKENKS